MVGVDETSIESLFQAKVSKEIADKLEITENLALNRQISRGVKFR